MFRTITARYAGTCKRCRQGFEAGTRIRFGGAGRTYHLKADCPVSAHELPTELQPGQTEPVSSEPVSSSDEPSGYYRGIHWSEPAADFTF